MAIPASTQSNVVGNRQVKVMNRQQTWDCIINPNQNLLQQLLRQTNLQAARFMYGCEWITSASTVSNLNLESGTTIDAFIPAVPQSTTEMVAHLQREGLNPSRFEYYDDGDMAIARIP